MVPSQRSWFGSPLYRFYYFYQIRQVTLIEKLYDNDAGDASLCLPCGDGISFVEGEFE